MIKNINRYSVLLLVILNVFATSFYVSSQTLSLKDFTPKEIEQDKKCCCSTYKTSCCGKSTCQCSVDDSKKSEVPENEAVLCQVIDGNLSLQVNYLSYYVDVYQTYKMVKYNTHNFKPPNIVQNITSIVIIC